MSVLEFDLLGRTELRLNDGRNAVALHLSPQQTALIAYLALGQPRGMRTRDEIVGVFWPERSERRARAALSQTLYKLRLELPDGVLLTRGEREVILQMAADRCDVIRFEQAVADDRLVEAAEAYRGELLAGFHLSGAGEFERWLTRERERLRTDARRALGTLADRARTDRNHAAAARWLDRALALDPYDEGIATNLVLALARCGDVSGAILRHDAFARRYRQDLEIEPSPEFLALRDTVAQTVRAETPPALRETREESLPDAGDDSVTARRANETVAAAGEAFSKNAAPDRVPPDSPATTGSPSGSATRVGSAARRGWKRVGALALAAGLVLTFSQRPDVPRADDSSIGAAAARTVVFLPVDVEGETRYEFLARGLPDLLAVALTVPDIIEVLVRHPSSDPPQGEPRQTAVGAAVQVSGALIDIGRVARVQLTARDAGGTVLGTANAEITEEDSVFGAIEELAAQLLGVLAPGRAGDATRIVSSGTHSVAALRAYLSGERSLRAGDFADAVRNFGDAVAADSLFAAAHYRLSVAAAWNSDPTLEWRSTVTAFRLAADLPEPFRLLATARHSLSVERNGLAAELALRQATRRFPRDSYAAHQLAELYFHRAGIWGIEAGIAREHFERAASLDPDNSATILHLARLAAYEDDGRTLVELSARLSTLDGEGRNALEGRALTALRAAASPIPHQLIEEFRSLDDPALIQAVFRLAAYARNPADARPFAELLTSPERPPPTAAMGHIALASLAVAAGRQAEARTHLDQAEPLDPRLALAARALFASLPWLPADSAELRVLSDRLSASMDSLTSPRTAASYPAARLLQGSLGPFLSGMIAVRLRNAVQAANVMERLRELPSADYLGRLLEASLVASSDTGHALAVLGEDSRAWDGDPAGIETWLRGRLLASVGRERDALRWFGAFMAELPWAFLGAAPGHLEQARILDRLGDPAAAAHYARVIELWSDADPILQDQLQLARDRLGALGAHR